MSVESESPLRGISQALGSILAAGALASFADRHLDGIAFAVFIATPVLMMITAIASLKRADVHSLAVFFSLLSLALSVHGLSINQGSGPAALGLVATCMTLAAMHRSR